MVDIDLCGMVSQEITSPEELTPEQIEMSGGCLGPNRNGFEIDECKKCSFYPKLKVLKFKLDKLIN